MHKIRISHEVPLAMLEESREFNDYDYALVHLFEDHPDYLQFYRDSLEMGREVLLDNSIFELREAFSFERFSYWIDILRPTKYVIPDVMHDMKGTIKNLHKWIVEYGHLPGKTIGVVQGKTYQELTECYLEIAALCDEISINVAKEYYPIIDSEMSEDWNYMCGRQTLIKRWVDEGVIDHSKKHHLLGCRLPQEFRLYTYLNYDFITSLDTSNPIVHGLLGKRYSDFGLLEKDKTLLADLIKAAPTKEQLSDIRFNVRTFKRLTHGI